MHAVIPHWEFTRELKDFGALGYQINTGIGGGDRRLEAAGGVDILSQRPRLLSIRVPARDLSTEGAAIAHAQTGLPQSLAAAMVSAAAVLGVVGLALMTLLVTRTGPVFSKEVLTKSMPLVRRTLSAVEKGVSAVAAQELGAGGKPGGQALAMAAATGKAPQLWSQAESSTAAYYYGFPHSTSQLAYGAAEEDTLSSVDAASEANTPAAVAVAGGTGLAGAAGRTTTTAAAATTTAVKPPSSRPRRRSSVNL